MHRWQEVNLHCSSPLNTLLAASIKEQQPKRSQRSQLWSPNYENEPCSTCLRGEEMASANPHLEIRLLQFVLIFLCGNNIWITKSWEEWKHWKRLGGWQYISGEDVGLTGSAACTGVDGFIPLVGAGHGEGALVHAIFTAAERRAARLEGCAAVGVRSA